MPDLTDRIEEVAGSPASASDDAGEVTNQDLSDIIAADKYLKGIAAVEQPNANGGPRSPWNSLRPGRFIPQSSQD